MNVAVICEFSGTVRDAFRSRGHFAISCDLLPTEVPGPHLMGDCRSFSWKDFDLIVAHPPCTYLANSGVRWLHTQDGRWNNMLEAVEFFNWCINLSKYCKYLVIENPIMHGYAKERIHKPYDQIIQPWQFGHGETKATCLWLHNLPLLQPTNIVKERKQVIHMLPPSKDRWKLRSKTYSGIADALAEQYGAL